MLNDQSIMVGGDPEFAIIGRFGKAVLASEVGIPPKHEKKKTQFSGSFFRDGASLEINPAPGCCRGDFNNATRNVLREAQKSLPPGYKLKALPTYSVTAKQLAAAPPDVTQFGCEPAFCAYHDGAPKIVNLDGRTHPYRYTGGHIHLTCPSVGNDRLAALTDPRNYPALIKLFDLYIGVMLAYIYDSPLEWQRRLHYGQAGEYRPQRHDSTYLDYERDPVYGGFIPTVGVKGGEGFKYRMKEVKCGEQVGIEYRTPSSTLWNQQAILSLVLGLSRWLISDFKDLIAKWDPKMEDAIRAAINSGYETAGLLRETPYYNLAMIHALKQREERNQFDLLTGEIEGHEAWYVHATKTWKLTNGLTFRVPNG